MVNDIGRNIKDKAEYLRRLLPRHPNANELQLFPALAEAPPDLQVPRPYASPPRGGRGEHVIFDDNDDYPQYYPDTSNRISSSSGGGGGSSGGNNSSSSSSGRRVYVGDLDDGMRSAGRAHKQRRKSAPYK